MGVVITDLGASIEFQTSPNHHYLMDKASMRLKQDDDTVYVTTSTGYNEARESMVLDLTYQTVTTPAYASNAELYAGLKAMILTANRVVISDPDGGVVELEPNNSLPVTLQDQTTPSVIAPMSILEETTTTTGVIAIDAYIIPVTSATGISAGKMLTLFDPSSIRFSYFIVISVASLNITVDRPVDFAYPSGTYVDVSEPNLAVNGSVTPVIAGLRNNAGATPPPGLALAMDVTRVLFHIIATSACNLTTFGDLAKLTDGITFRRRDGAYYNIFNAKSNGEMKEIMYDIEIVATGNPASGEDGVFGRLTFGGQSKLGVVQRIAINEDVELIISDDLSGLTLFQMTAEGSIVEP